MLLKNGWPSIFQVPKMSHVYRVQQLVPRYVPLGSWKVQHEDKISFMVEHQIALNARKMMVVKRRMEIYTYT